MLILIGMKRNKLSNSLNNQVGNRMCAHKITLERTKCLVHSLFQVTLGVLIYLIFMNRANEFNEFINERRKSLSGRRVIGGIGYF